MSGLSRYIPLMQKWNNRLYFVSYRGYRKDPWTYSKIRNTVLRLSGELKRRGIRKGDRIILIGAQSPEWVVAFFAILHRGAVVVPIEQESQEEFILKIIQKTSPSLIISDTTRINRDGGTTAGTNSSDSGEEKPSAFLLSSEKILYFSSITDISSRSDSLSREAEAEPIHADDLAEIVFTSGTTSRPKGVMLTHNNILSNLKPFEEGIEKHKRLVKLLTPFRILCTVPYSHMLGQVTGIFLPILIGSTIYISYDTSPATLLRTIRRDRILTLITVPRVMKLLTDHLKADLTARGRMTSFTKRWERWVDLPWPIRVFFFLDVHRFMGLHFWSFITGGAPLDPETHEFWRRTVFSIFQGYGLTETAPMVSMFNPFKHNLHSVGKIFPGQSVRFDHNGEILVKGENIMAGYFDDPTLTASVMKDGWFRTGDVGEVDAQGQLYIKGRKKDMILTSDGHNVYPEDIENILNSLEGVRESVVFGKPGPAGESIHAVILPEADTDPEQIISSANSRLKAHQKIRSFSLWKAPDFPRTSTLKVRKTEVIREVMDTEKTSEPTGNILEGLVAGSAGKDAKLGDDLGMDSLDMVEIVSRIEKKYGITLDETLIGPETTVGEIEKLALQPPEKTAISMPRWARRKLIRFPRRIILGCVILPVFRVLCRIRVSGLKYLKEVKGPRILCANHSSDLDPLALLGSLPPSWRKLIAPAMGLNRFHAYFSYLGKAAAEDRAHASEMEIGTKKMKRFLHGFLFYLITFLFQAYPFPQGAAYRPSLEYSGELLDAGCWLLIFPEGRVSSTGKINRFKGGIAVLAERTAAPIFPVGIKGMHDILPPGRTFPKRGRASVSFGKPIYYNEEGHEDFASKVEEAVRLLCEER